MPGGALAAERARARIEQIAKRRFAHATGTLAIELVGKLVELDRVLYADVRAGETTALCVHVDATHVSLASAGDSSVYRYANNTLMRETPAVAGHRLGSGRADPIPSTFATRGRLLLTTDGLTRATTTEAIESALRDPDLDQAFSRLAEQSERSEDDVCFLLLELNPSVRA